MRYATQKCNVYVQKQKMGRTKRNLNICIILLCSSWSLLWYLFTALTFVWPAAEDSVFSIQWHCSVERPKFHWLEWKEKYRLYNFIYFTKNKVLVMTTCQRSLSFAQIGIAVVFLWGFSVWFSGSNRTIAAPLLVVSVTYYRDRSRATLASRKGVFTLFNVYWALYDQQFIGAPWHHQNK